MNHNRMTEILSYIFTDLISPSIFAMCPKICAKEFGIIPRSSGTVRTPSMVNVFPVPVCPYAKIVPGNMIFSTSNSKMDHTGLKIKKKKKKKKLQGQENKLKTSH